MLKRRKDRVNHQRKTGKKAEDNSELYFSDRNTPINGKKQAQKLQKQQQPQNQQQFLNSLARLFRSRRITRALPVLFLFEVFVLVQFSFFVRFVEQTFTSNVCSLSCVARATPHRKSWFIWNSFCHFFAFFSSSISLGHFKSYIA